MYKTSDYYIKDWTHRSREDCKTNANFTLIPHDSVHQYAWICNICGGSVGWSKRAEHNENIKRYGLIDDELRGRIIETHNQRLHDTHHIVPAMLPQEYVDYMKTGRLPSKYS